MTTTTNAPRRAQLFGWAWTAVPLFPVAIVLVVLETTAISLTPIWIGIPASLAMIAAVRRFADMHRRQAGRVLGEEIPRPYAPVPQRGQIIRLIAVLKDRATWRDLWWMFVEITAGFALSLASVATLAGGIGHLTLGAWWWALPDDAEVNLIGFLPVHDTASALILGVPLGLTYLAVWWIFTPALMRARALLAKSLLAPTERSQLLGRVQQLTVSRADTVDTQAAELRRIERDLHDGAQARLVALGMSLGMAEEIVSRNPAAAQELLAEARAASSQALSELRDLVRGIHPPVLADRGLDGAIQALVLSHSLPIDVEVDIPGRLPAPAESAAYFAVAETVTNVVKHAGAGKAWIRLGYADGRLNILVGDNGHGGADPADGTGLRGIERRLAAFDGTLVVSSPIGGPTVVVMNLPADLAKTPTT